MTSRILFSLISLGLVAAAPATAQSLTTTFAGGNSGSAGWTNQFDITVLNASGVTITAFDINCENSRSGPLGSAFTIDVHVTRLGGTYVGNEINATAWTRVSTGNGISGPLGTPTNVDVADFSLAAGTYGIALYYTGSPGTAMAYTNGTGANQSYSNADIRLDLGASTGGFFAGAIYSPRVWNGCVYYSTTAAAWSTFGSGCTGTAGEPTIGPAQGTLPQLGTTFLTEFGNLPAPASLVFVGVGFSRTQWGANPLPFSLAPLGAPGCNLLISLDVTAQTAGAPNVAILPLPVPLDQNLIGVVLYEQGFVVDPGANAIGLIATKGGAARVGI